MGSIRSLPHQVLLQSTPDSNVNASSDSHGGSIMTMPTGSQVSENALEDVSMPSRSTRPLQRVTRSALANTRGDMRQPKKSIAKDTAWGSRGLPTAPTEPALPALLPPTSNETSIREAQLIEEPRSAKMLYDVTRDEY